MYSEAGLNMSIDLAVGIDETFQNALSSSFDRIQLKKDDRNQVVAMICNSRNVMVHGNCYDQVVGMIRLKLRSGCSYDQVVLLFIVSICYDQLVAYGALSVSNYHILSERDTLALKFASLKYVPSLEFSEIADRDQTLCAFLET
jgi:hypothetical protein